MMAELGTLRGGELDVAITSAVVGIHSVHLGRGPKTATTFHQNNVIVTVVREVMAQLERTLARNENEDAAGHVRHLFQKTMEAGRTDAVERLTGRKVIAFVSGTNFNPEIASELFILDSGLYPITPGPAAPPQTTRTVGCYEALRAGSFRTRPSADTHPRFPGPAKPLRVRIPAARAGRRWRRGGEPCS